MFKRGFSSLANLLAANDKCFDPVGVIEEVYFTHDPVLLAAVGLNSLKLALNHSLE